MIEISDSERRHAFSQWLRTGRLASIRGPEGIELKFNPWHDPADGRFTFAGSGRYHGAGSASQSNRASGSAARVYRDKPAKPQTVTKPRAENPRPVQGAGNRSTSRREDRPNPMTEFAAGVGEGLYDVAEATVKGTYSALTTNPLTTCRQRQARDRRDDRYRDRRRRYAGPGPNLPRGGCDSQCDAARNWPDRRLRRGHHRVDSRTGGRAWQDFVSAPTTASPASPYL